MLIISSLLAACGSSAELARPTTVPETKISKSGMLHGLNDFTQVIKKGAENAGKDVGVEVEVTGPAGFVSTEAIGMLKDGAERKSGLVVVPQPGEIWVVPIKEASDARIPVMTANVTSPGSLQRPGSARMSTRRGSFWERKSRKSSTARGKKNGKLVVGCAHQESLCWSSGQTASRKIWKTHDF